MIIKELQQSNISEIIEQIAQIHASAYSRGHFTAAFDLQKLKEYNEQLVLSSDLSIVALDGNDVLGFIISGDNVSAGVQQFIQDNRMWLFIKLLKTPDILFKKILGMIRVRLNPSMPSQATFRLLSIATKPGVQSKGIGTKMIDYFEQELLRRNITIYGLSVKKSNRGAVRFYERHGFIREKVYLGSSYYIKKINKG